MVLSYKTRTFQDSYDEIEQKVESGEITSQADKNAFLEEKGISAEEYNQAFQDQLKDAMEGKITTSEDLEPAGKGFITGLAGRAVGEAGRGFANLASALAPEEVNEFVSSALDTTGTYIPDSVKKAFQETFDPYHGEGIMASIEEGGGELASYAIPYVGIGKVYGAVSAGSKALASPGLKSLAGKVSKELTKSQKRKAALSSLGAGAKFAGAATIVEDPEENLVNILREEFPDSTTYLERLRVNPNDTEAEKYLQALLNNLGIEGTAIGLLGALSKPTMELATFAYKPIKEASKSLSSLVKLPNLPASFSSRLGTNDTILTLIEEQSRAAKGALIRAEGIASDLSKTIRDEYSTNIKAAEDTVSEALKGDKKALNSLKPEIKKLVIEMRDNVSKASKEAGQGTRGKLKATINKNADVYLTGTYDFFDDPVYRRSILKKYKNFKQNPSNDPDGIFSSALKGIMESNNLDENEAAFVLEKMMGKGNNKEAGNIIDAMLGYQQGITSSKSGKQRKNLPGSLRELLGEVKDPYKNYSKTMANLAQINAENNFLTKVSEHLRSPEMIGKQAFTKKQSFLRPWSLPKTGEQLFDLGEVGSQRLSKTYGSTAVQKGEVKNPLMGLHVNKDYKKAIEEGLNVMQPNGKWMKGFLKAKGLSQAAKTAYNPSTHGRNITGNQILMFANGMLTPTGENLSTISKRLRGLNNRELNNKIAEYTELGIANTGVNLGVVRKNLNSFADNSEEALKSIYDRKDFSSADIGEMGRNAFKKLEDNKILDTYQAEDDLFKIAHYEKTLEYIKKSDTYKKLPLAEQKKIAAERTKDMLPNYSRVPKFFKEGAASIVGDYVSFPVEATRVAKNIAKYAIRDINSGDKELVKQGYRRLGGLTTVAAAPAALTAYTANLMGITGSQQDAVNNLGADYNYNTDKIYLSPIREDENKKMSVDFINLGPIDPFSFLKDMAYGANALVTGAVTGELAEVELDKIALTTLDKTLGTFLSPSMITQGLIDVYEGKQGEDAARFKPLVDVFTPGFVNWVAKRYDYEQSKRAAEGTGLGPKAKGGAYYYDGGAQSFPALLGLKVDRLDFTSGAKFNINPLIQEIEGAGSEFDYTLRNDPNFGSGLFSGQDTNKVTNLYIDANKKRLEGYQKLKSVMDDYKEIYGDTVYSDILDSITDNGKKKIKSGSDTIIFDALDNYFEPFDLKDKYYYEENQVPLDYESIINLFDQLQGSRILD